MTADRVREYLRARPFEPFALHLADGCSHVVTHPEAIVLSPSGRTAVVSRGGNAVSVIDVLLVTELEINPANGRRKKRAARP